MPLRSADRLPRRKSSSAHRLLLATVSLSAFALAGCNAIVQTRTFDLTRRVTTPTDGSAAIAYLDQPVIQAGSPPATVIIHGAGFQSGSQLLFDGAAHAATYNTPVEMQFSLSAAELVSPGRHPVQVQNPGTAIPASNTVALLVTSGYAAFGDSITYGAGLSAPSAQAYPALVATRLSLNVQNLGINGDQACDLFPHRIYPEALGYTTIAAPLYSVMLGTNDADHYGAGSYEAVYNHCHQAVLTWLGTRRADKLLAGDAALTGTGGCSTTADPLEFGGMTCSAGTPGTITASAFRTGPAIYVWYTLRADAPADRTFSVTIDGAYRATATARPEVSIATFNGTNTSVSVLRLPVSAGIHTVTIQTAGGTAIQGIGTNRGGPTIPQLLVGDIPWQLSRDPSASLSTQEHYSADIQANIAQALADGLDVRFARDRVTMWGTREEMFDQVHPNALGHEHLATAYLAALQ